MSGTDVREVRAHMVGAADKLRDAVADVVTCDRTHPPVRYQLPRDVVIAMTYAEGILRTLATTILPPDPPADDRPTYRPGYNAATRPRDGRGRFLPRETT